MKRIFIVFSTIIVAFLGSCQKDEDTTLSATTNQGIEKTVVAPVRHFTYNVSGLTYIGGQATCGAGYENRNFIVGGLSSSSSVPLRADYCYMTISNTPGQVNAIITNGTATYIAENGDRLYATFNARCLFGNYLYIPQLQTSMPMSLTFAPMGSSGIITGGTGQYAGVRGTFSLQCYQDLGPMYLGRPSPTILTAEGAIFYSYVQNTSPTDN